MDTLRIQIDCAAEHAETLQGLIDACHLSDHKDLFNSALTFFAWAVAERRAGRVVASVDEAAQRYREAPPALFSGTSAAPVAALD